MFYWFRGIVVFCAVILTADAAINGPSDALLIPVSEAGTVARIAPSSLAPFSVAEDGTRFLVLRLEGPGAVSKLRFRNLHLPQGARLYVYGLDLTGAPTGIQGPFELSGPTPDGEFWTQSIPAQVVLVELQVNEIPRICHLK